MATAGTSSIMTRYIEMLDDQNSMNATVSLTQHTFRCVLHISRVLEIYCNKMAFLTLKKNNFKVCIQTAESLNESKSLFPLQ